MLGIDLGDLRHLFLKGTETNWYPFSQDIHLWHEDVRFGYLSL